MHRHKYIEISYVAEGQISANIEGREILMKQGDLCIMDKNVQHSSKTLGVEDWIFNPAMRLFDGITDPVIGNLIDRVETKFGKFRPFLVIGSLILLGSSFAIYLGSFAIPQGGRLLWVILWYAVWVIGYTCMTTVNKCVLSVVTKNPKFRPISGIAGGIYSTIIYVFFPSPLSHCSRNSAALIPREAGPPSLWLLSFSIWYAWRAICGRFQKQTGRKTMRKIRPNVCKENRLIFKKEHVMRKRIPTAKTFIPGWRIFPSTAGCTARCV